MTDTNIIDDIAIQPGAHDAVTFRHVQLTTGDDGRVHAALFHSAHAVSATLVINLDEKGAELLLNGLAQHVTVADHRDGAPTLPSITKIVRAWEDAYELEGPSPSNRDLVLIAYTATAQPVPDDLVVDLMADVLFREHMHSIPLDSLGATMFDLMVMVEPERAIVA